MRTRCLRFLPGVSATIVAALTLTISERARGDERGKTLPPQRTSGVIARVGIEDYPVGCNSSTGIATDQHPWTNGSSSHCSIASQQENVDGLMILIQWSTLQPDRYGEPLSSYYIDNAIYSLAHPERQHIHLAVLAGTHSPVWLTSTDSRASFPDRYAGGICKPSAGGPSPQGAPGTVWNTFYFTGLISPLKSMPNPFGTNSCLFTALDDLVYKLGRSGQYNYPRTSTPYPRPLAPYDNLYYDAAPGRTGFVHTNTPTATMNKIIGHVSALGPHSYDGESVLCHVEADCESISYNTSNGYNFGLWQSLYDDDFSMEGAIESAQKRTIDIYAVNFPTTFWTVDLVERQMPFFQPDGMGCRVVPNAYPPTGPGPGASDASDCFGKLRTNIINYIQAYYPSRGGVQNNSLGRPGDMAQHPVWMQTALAAQDPPLNPVRLFVGLQVGAPEGFYQGDSTFAEFEADAQTAVNRAKQMVTNYRPVNFIEFYDVDITNSNPVNIPPPSSPINDAPDGVASGGYLYVPLTDAHQNLPGPGG
jgi:hypothetical protein